MIHIAGPYVDLVQRCVRCGRVITDNNGAMYPADMPPPGAWTEGAHLEISGRNPIFYAVVDLPADCEVVQ